MANDLGIPKYLVNRVFAIFRNLGKAPSQERLCVCVLNHPDLGDEQIADLFGRNVRWVDAIRSRKQEIREAEPFPESLEYLDEGFTEDDPTPFEISVRVNELKSLWIDGIEGNYADGIMPYGRAASRRAVRR